MSDTFISGQQRILLAALITLPIAVAQAHPMNPAMLLDQNADGVVSADEIQSAVQEKSQRIDSNKNGLIDAEELKAARQARRSQRRQRHIEKSLARADANGDGVVSIREFSEARTQRLMERDKNSNGTLDGDEITLPGKFRRPPATGHKRCD